MKPMRDIPFWAECHLDADINEPEEASDIVEKARQTSPEFFSVALDVD